MKIRPDSTDTQPPTAGHVAAPARAPTNIAARMGRWSAGHWKTATFAWVGFVVIAFAVGTLSGTTTIDSSTSGYGESGRVSRIIEAGFRQPASESVLIQSSDLAAEDPAFRAAV